MIDTSTPLPGLTEADALATLSPADADRFRLVVTHDPDADGPFQWGHLVAVDVVTAYGGHAGDRFAYGTDDLGLTEALARFCDRIPAEPGHWANPDAAAEAAIRWAAIFHGVTVRRVAFHGVSQGDWSDCLVYLQDADERRGEQAEPLDAWIGDARAWYSGEVYGVRLDRLTAEGEWTTEPDCDVWGFYLDAYGPRRYTAADAAVDAYGLPRAFAEGIPVVYADTVF